MKSFFMFSLAEIACAAVLCSVAWLGGRILPVFAELDATGWVLVITAIGAILSGIVGQIISYLKLREQKVQLDTQDRQLADIHSAVNASSSASEAKQVSTEDTIQKMLKATKGMAIGEKLAMIVETDKRERDRQATEIVARAAAAKAVTDAINAEDKKPG